MDKNNRVLGLKLENYGLLLHSLLPEIERLPFLKMLKLQNFDSNTLSSFLKNLEEINWLDLSNCNLYGVKFLKKMKTLQNLNLSNNKLKDVSFLRELKNLRILDLSWNNLIDVSFLREL